MSGAQKNLKTHYKKGQPLFQAGQKADRVFILQQGLVAVSMPGVKGSIDLFKATQPQLLGEEALKNLPTYETTAVAINDSAVVEIPIQQAKTFLESCAPLLKQLFLGLMAKHKAINAGLITNKRAAEAVPCPKERVPKMFTVIHQVAAYTGKKKDDAITVTWPAFKKYCQRVFLESPVRLEQAMYMLSNLGIATLEMVKDENDEDAPEDLGFIHFRRLDEVARFAEHYRAHMNKLSGDAYEPFIKQLEFWNTHGMPEGMAEVLEARAKASAIALEKKKKRAA